MHSEQWVKIVTNVRRTENYRWLLKKFLLEFQFHYNCEPCEPVWVVVHQQSGRGCQCKQIQAKFVSKHVSWSCVRPVPLCVRYSVFDFVCYSCVHRNLISGNKFRPHGQALFTVTNWNYVRKHVYVHIYGTYIHTPTHRPHKHNKQAQARRTFTKIPRIPRYKYMFVHHSDHRGIAKVFSVYRCMPLGPGNVIAINKQM